MDNIWIENPKNFRKPIPLTSIFAEDSQKLYAECRWIMRAWLYPYEICSSPDSPKTFSFGVRDFHGNPISHDISFGQKLERIPDGKEKISISRANWRMERNNHFNAIFNIAQKHKVTMKWCGNQSPACGDQWIISNGSEEIGILRI